MNNQEIIQFIQNLRIDPTSSSLINTRSYNNSTRLGEDIDKEKAKTFLQQLKISDESILPLIQSYQKQVANFSATVYVSSDTWNNPLNKQYTFYSGISYINYGYPLPSVRPYEGGGWNANTKGVEFKPNQIIVYSGSTLGPPYQGPKNHSGLYINGEKIPTSNIINTTKGEVIGNNSQRISQCSNTASTQLSKKCATAGNAFETSTSNNKYPGLPNWMVVGFPNSVSSNNVNKFINYLWENYSTTQTLEAQINNAANSINIKTMNIYIAMIPASTANAKQTICPSNNCLAPGLFNPISLKEYIIN